MTVLDWSFSPPPFGELAGAGVTGAVRYLGGQASLSPGERDALRSAGLALGLVWEQGAARALQGFSAGAEDRRSAEGAATALGMEGCALYLACDTDAKGNAAVRNYFHGAASAADPAWRRGGYVGDDPGGAMLDEGTLDLLWQPAASSWSWVYPSPRAALVQKVGQTLRLSGGSWDENDVQAPDWGQWPSAADAPPQEEDDMPYIAYGPKVGYLGNVAFWVSGGKVGPQRWNGHEDDFGIPQAAKDWNGSAGRGFKYVPLTVEDIDALLTTPAPVVNNITNAGLTDGQKAGLRQVIAGLEALAT